MYEKGKVNIPTYFHRKTEINETFVRIIRGAGRDFYTGRRNGRDRKVNFYWLVLLSLKCAIVFKN
jgi:hypothetical protein